MWSSTLIDDLGYTLDNAIDDVASIEEFAITASRHGSSTSAVSFSDVLSIFQANCTVCHSGSSPSAGLDLSSYAGVMSGGNNGAVVVAGDAANSRLVQALEGTLAGVSRMPLGGSPLSESDIHNVIEAWINQGASSS